jgi:hypothetical protein
MSETVRMVIRDPATFHLLTADLKEQIIKGGINTVNVEGFLTRKKAQENIRSSFTTRNQFTERSVMVTPMPQGRYALSAIHSIVGITERAAYMERQEEGGLHTPASGHSTLSIPTDTARGGSRAAAVQGRFRLSKIKSLKVRGKSKAKGGTHKSRAVARAAVAFRERKLVQYGGNLHFVESFHANAGKVAFRLRQVYGFDKPSTRTKPQPWMRPAHEKVARDREKIFISQMKKLGM